MPRSNWKQFHFQPALHTACATQSHSFHPLTIHSSSRLRSHSRSTDHSLIPQAHAIVPLHLPLVQEKRDELWNVTYWLISCSEAQRLQKLKSPLLWTQGWQMFSLKAWSRSEYSHVCFAYCQELLPCPNFDFSQSIHLHFVSHPLPT